MNLVQPREFIVKDSVIYAAGQWIVASSDNGGHWDVVVVPPSDTMWDMYEITPTDNDFLILGFIETDSSADFRMLGSTNRGKSWHYCKDLFYQVIGWQNIFFGTMDSSISVFMSTDAGKNWEGVSDGLLPREAYSLAVIDDQLYTGTYTKGLWRRPLTELGLRSGVHEKVQSTERLRIYPNPTSGATTITLTAESSGYVDVRIVNMLGEQVASIFSGELDATEHTFTWDTGKMVVPRGRYEVVIRMNGRTLAVPLVVE